MMQYLHCLRNVHYQSTAICRQIICVDIEVKYFCDNIIITTRHRYVFFCEYNAQNLAWNWYGRFSSIPFHSILASSIFHTEIFVPFHTMPWVRYASKVELKYGTLQGARYVSMQILNVPYRTTILGAELF